MNTDTSQAFRLSPQQRRIWHECQASRRNWSLRIAVSLGDTTEFARLEFAARRLIDAHEILRTRFSTVQGLRHPCQIVEREPSIRFEQRERLPQLPLFDHLPSPDPACPLATILTSSARTDVLLLSIPSLCTDMLSMHILLRQLGELYANPSAELQVPVQYADYGEWRNEMSASEEEDDFSGFSFRRYLNGYPNLFDLPFSALSELCNRQYHTHATHLDAQLLEGLSRIAAGQGVQLPEVLLALWGVLLHRHANVESIGILTHLDGRTMPELREAVGPFENWVPNWVTCSQGITFADVVRSVSHRMTQIIGHQDRYAFDGRYAAKLRESPPTAAFSYVELPTAVPPLVPSWKILDVQHPMGDTRLSLDAVRNEEGVLLRVFCDKAICNEGTAAAILPRFLRLSTDVSSFSSSRPVTAMNILTEPDLSSSISVKSTDRAHRRSIVESFEQQVAHHPDRPAVVSQDRYLSYGELYRRSGQLASTLVQSSEFPREAIIALAIERSIDAVVALMGVLLTGRAYAFVDLSGPNIRLQAQLESLHPAIIVATANTSSRFEVGDWPASILLATSESTSGSFKPLHPNIRSLAYVVQTSGSTGTPKNVAITHEGLAAYIEGVCHVLGIDLHDGTPLNFAVVSALHADLANTCIFGALASGGCLHLLDPREATDAHAFASFMRRHSIDVLKIVPSHLEALLAVRENATLPRRALLLGGESFPLSLAELIREFAPEIRVFNHYGPSEATVGCLVYPLSDRPINGWARSVPLGYPLQDVQIYLVNRDLYPVPPGSLGELCVSGPGLARGYAGAPAITAERFVPCPFGSSGTRMYRTGDLARELPDGTIEFLGRNDDQVKIRGYRVELTEIETALNAHPDVDRALVISVRSQGNEKHLCAYYLSRRGSALSAQELQNFLQGHLPDHMVPAHFIQLSSMPLTENGKINRAALPVPDISAGPDSKHSRDPLTPTELRIAEIWRTILGVDRIGVHDRFLDLGGHSLMATQIVARVRSLFGVDLSLSSFFAHATIAGMIDDLSAHWESREEFERFAQSVPPNSSLSVASPQKPPLPVSTTATAN